MRLNLKELVEQFQREYGIEPPTKAAICEATNCHQTSISRMFRDPQCNITTKTLESLVQFLYNYYKNFFTEVPKEKLMAAIQKKIITFNVEL
jgi:sulfur relay (sulfurtransferase) DsrC/TusE family protein